MGCWLPAACADCSTALLASRMSRAGSWHRLNGIGTRVSYAKAQAERQKNIGAYTFVVTNAITGHIPKAWNKTILPGPIWGKGSRSANAPTATIDLMAEAAERGCGAQTSPL